MTKKAESTVAKETKSAFISRGVGVFLMAAVTLFGLWLASFASNSSVKALEYRVMNIEEDAETYAKKTDLALIMSGLCIIDARTCKLNKQ